MRKDQVVILTCRLRSCAFILLKKEYTLAPHTMDQMVGTEVLNSFLVIKGVRGDLNKPSRHLKRADVTTISQQCLLFKSLAVRLPLRNTSLNLIKREIRDMVRSR